MVDDLLHTNVFLFNSIDKQKNFQLGVLLKGTVEKAQTAVDETHSFEDMKKAFLFSAKNQVTLWGPNGEINDYSAREWAGLVGDYYYGRWNLYFDMLFDCLDRNTTLDHDVYHAKAVEYGLSWDSDVRNEERSLYLGKYV